MSGINANENDKQSTCQEPPLSFNFLFDSMLTLTVNHDIFKYGVLRSHKKLEPENLRRTIIYCLKKQQNINNSAKENDNTSNKANQNYTNPAMDQLYPTLSWKSWRYIAVLKLQISETLAWSYFDTYLAIHSSEFEKERQNFCEKRGRYLNYENPINTGEYIKNKRHKEDFKSVLITSTLPQGTHYEKYRSVQTVPTLKFVLYLYLQQLAFDPKRSIRRSLSGENWPDPSGDNIPTRSNSLSRTPRESSNLTPNNIVRPNSSLGFSKNEKSDGQSGTNINDENSAINFIKDNIMKILYVAAPISEKKESKFITVEILKALGLLINWFKYDPSSNKYTKVDFWQVLNGKQLSERSLKSIICSHLVLSPLGISGTTVNGVAIKEWGLNSNTLDNLTSQNFKIFTNSQISSPCSMKIFISGLHDSSIIRFLPKDSNFDVTIHRCENSTIYIFGCMKNLSVERSRNCNIILGSVYSVCRLIHFRKSKITVGCRLLTAANCSDLTISLHSQSHPLLLGQCKKITFGPINVNYSFYSYYLCLAGLPNLPTLLFSKPLYLFDTAVSGIANKDSSRRNSLTKKDIKKEQKNLDNPIVSIMPPNDYYPTGIPLNSNMITKQFLKSFTNLDSENYKKHPIISSTEQLCDYAPDEYKSAWYKKLAHAKCIKDEIRKAISGKFFNNLSRDDSSEYVNLSKMSNAGEFVSGNIKFCFQKWLEESGNLKEIDKINDMIRDVQI